MLALLDKAKSPDNFSLANIPAKQYQTNQKSLMASMDGDRQSKSKPAAAIGLRHGRNFSIDKPMPAADLKLVFPKTS
jgi:hypothetical protein